MIVTSVGLGFMEDFEGFLGWLDDDGGRLNLCLLSLLVFFGDGIGEYAYSLMMIER